MNENNLDSNAQDFQQDLQVTPSSSAETIQQAEAVNVKYAGFWIRYVANIIDGVIVAVFSFIPAFIIGLVLGGILEQEGIAALMGQLLGYIISFGYFITLTYKKEATWGKMALGLKVISSEKEKLGLGQVILRETVGKIVSGIILGIGYIMAGFTERKQALHDKLANTYVIYKDPSRKSNAWIIAVVIVFFSIAFIGIFAAIVLVSLNNAKQKANEARLRQEFNSSEMKNFDSTFCTGEECAFE